MPFQPISPVRTYTVAANPPVQPEHAPAATTAPASLDEVAMTADIASSADKTSEVPSDFSQANTADTHETRLTSNTGGKPKRSASWKGGMTKMLKRAHTKTKAEKRISKAMPRRISSMSSKRDSVTSSKRSSLNGKMAKELPLFELPALEKRDSKGTTNSSVVDPAYDPAAKKFKDKPKIQMASLAVTGPDEPRSFLDLDTSSDDESPVIHRANSVRVGKPRLVRHVSKTAQHAQNVNHDSLEKDAAFMEQAPDVEVHRLSNLYEVAPNEESQAIPGGPEDTLHQLEGGSAMSMPPTPSEAEGDHGFIKDTFVDAEQKPDSEATDTISTLPTPSITSPLFSNPPNTSSFSHPRLARTQSAPMPPNRNPNRRVTIRPSDLVIHTPDHNHRLFRESIVTTPYPPASAIDAITTPTSLTALPPINEKTKPILSHLNSHSTQPATAVTDRFPSPTHSNGDEIMHIYLRLSRHPNTQTLLTITIPSDSKTTFDDSTLFTQLRHQYHSSILGMTRRWLFNARTLTHATAGEGTLHLDGVGFAQHLLRPKTGKGRKSWVAWLRAQQPLRDNRASSVFSGASPVDEKKEKEPFAGSLRHKSTTSTQQSGRSSYWSPLHHSAQGVPRMPFQRVEMEYPVVVLYHRFDLLRISLATMVVVLGSVVAMVLWALFGVPGLRLGDGSEVVLGGGMVGWKRDADVRVLTGLVMGLVVLIVGGVGVGGWVGGSWVLV